MNNLVPFSFEDKSIRVVSDERGEPLFVAKDVAEALDYVWNGTSRIEHVPVEWRMVTSVVTTAGLKDMAVLTEQGLYFFLGRSDKPKALPFQKWIAGDVLPSIRKTGAYIANPTKLVGAAEAVPALMSAAKAFGFVGNQAILSTNQAIAKHYGVNLLEDMGQTHLPAPHNEALLTPTDLALRLGIGKLKANPLLIDCGLQVIRHDHKDRPYYELTDAGKEYGIYLDTGKKAHGTPVRQIKWRTGVLPILEARHMIEVEEA